MIKSLTVAAAAACALSFAASGATADPREPTAVEVKIARSELRNAQSVERTYDQLRRAAHRACNSNSIVPTTQREDRACAADALNTTVAQISAPLLTARHQTVSSTRFARGY